MKKETAQYSGPIAIIAAKAHDILMTRLKNAGYEIRCITPNDNETWLSTLPYAAGIVVASGIRVDESFLNKAPQLRWIARLGSGMELIDVAAAESRGVKVYSSPEGNANAVGEYALGMLLGLMRNITSSSKEVAEDKWLRELNRGYELSGKIIGIIGFGNTGRALARVLRGFDVSIIAHDKYLFGFGNEHVKEASLEEVLKSSHVLSLHLPLTKETFHYANDHFFSRLEQQPVIINTSRGEVLDTRSLLRAFDQRRISGAALDVLENENLPTYSSAEKEILSTLLNKKQVLVTPHIAGYSHEAFYKMSLVIADKMGI
jgi:D-3-phosphoglycerate dehydrogenase